MTKAELARRQERVEREVFVISRTEEGYRVYTPRDPNRPYIVSGTSDRFLCTCPDFEKHASDPEWQCKHALAVRKHLGSAAAAQRESEDGQEGRREASAQPPQPPVASTVLPQMFVKRSVSPDGRIDSLSVGVSWPIDGSTSELRARVEKVLKLQADVVERFLAQNDKKHEHPQDAPPETASSQAAPARMVAIGGMDGRWGRRLFLTFDVNGKPLRLFGTEKRLGEAIAAAGFPERAGKVAEGMALDLPCRVMTVPSPDGRFLNVERVLPAATR